MTSTDAPISLPFDIDNRDGDTTELHIHHYGSGLKVEVNPWELVKNVIENCVQDEAAQARFLATLDQLHTDFNCE